MLDGCGRTAPRERDDRLVVSVVGASTRAFAESACLAGWAVYAADLFGDVDLRRAAVHVVSASVGLGYPRGLPAAIAAWPPGPCVYTGAIENHPDIIDGLAQSRPVAGCSAATVRAVRDPGRLAAAIRAAGGSFPETFADPAGLPCDGSFVVKPLASAAGRDISRWRGAATSPAAGRVWQRFIAGNPWSAAFVADPQGCRLIGASHQLVGRRWCGGRPFAYCGSVGVPLDHVGRPLRAVFERLGAALAVTFGLVGLFNIDVVIAARGDVYVIEVNPRPTASMELVERATGESLAAAHLAACGWASPPLRRPAAGGGPMIWSKAIVFASRSGDDVVIPPDRLETATAAWSDADGMSAIADIQHHDSRIPPGAPILTVFARAETAEHSLAILRQRVTLLRQLVAGIP
ncbi:MAG: ATP-grasp domain-containing protein [Planctomycetia bacterium]|nr:ATP-grasp domain-containing protein [Planctomycetia bacterium]